MILYQVIGHPYFDPSYEKFCLNVKIGYGGVELKKDELMFEDEDDAWAVYHKVNSTFEPLNEDDITEAILTSREVRDDKHEM